MTTETREPTALEWLRDIAANGYRMSVWLRDGSRTDPEDSDRGELYPETIVEGLAQAAAEERRRLIAVVEALPTSATVWTGEPLVRRAVVLAALKGTP